MNSGLVHSELNYNYRLFAKTISSSAAWGFDRFRLFNSKWHTKIQVRRLDGSVVATQSFAPDGAFEHTFSFDLSGNVTNEEYSVYIAGVAVGQNFNQAYAWPTGYSATTGKNAELTYWDFSQVNIVFSGTSGRIRFENNPITNIDGAALLNAGEINFANCQLDAETLADMLIGLNTNGGTGGSFNYSGNLAAPAERALSAYNMLKDTKAWTLTGAIPAAAAPLYDADYQAVLDYATANAIALPTTIQQDLDNQIMINYKSSGGYTKSDFIFQFETTADIAFRLICWKRKILAISYGSPTWSNSGWAGNGTNAYIDPLYNTSSAGLNWALNDAGVAWKSFQKSNVTSATIIGGFSGVTSDYVLIIPNDGATSYRSINGDFVAKGNYGQLGLNAVNRISSTQIQVHDNAPVSSNSGGKYNNKIMIGARWKASGPIIDLFTNEGIGFIAVGANMSAEYAEIKTAING